MRPDEKIELSLKYNGFAIDKRKRGSESLIFAVDLRDLSFYTPDRLNKLINDPSFLNLSDEENEILKKETINQVVRFLSICYNFVQYYENFTKSKTFLPLDNVFDEVKGQVTPKMKHKIASKIGVYIEKHFESFDALRSIIDYKNQTNKKTVFKNIFVNYLTNGESFEEKKAISESLFDLYSFFSIFVRNSCTGERKFHFKDYDTPEDIISLADFISFDKKRTSQNLVKETLELFRVNRVAYRSILNADYVANPTSTPIVAPRIIPTPTRVESTPAKKVKLSIKKNGVIKELQEGKDYVLEGSSYVIEINEEPTRKAFKDIPNLDRVEENEVFLVNNTEIDIFVKRDSIDYFIRRVNNNLEFEYILVTFEELLDKGIISYKDISDENKEKRQNTYDGFIAFKRQYALFKEKYLDLIESTRIQGLRALNDLNDQLVYEARQLEEVKTQLNFSKEIKEKYEESVNQAFETIRADQDLVNHYIGEVREVKGITVNTFNIDRICAEIDERFVELFNIKNDIDFVSKFNLLVECVKDLIEFLHNAGARSSAPNEEISELIDMAKEKAETINSLVSHASISTLNVDFDGIEEEIQNVIKNHKKEVLFAINSYVSNNVDNKKFPAKYDLNSIEVEEVEGVNEDEYVVISNDVLNDIDVEKVTLDYLKEQKLVSKDAKGVVLVIRGPEGIRNKVITNKDETK